MPRVMNRRLKAKKFIFVDIFREFESIVVVAFTEYLYLAF